nr:lytic murein transglycosylase B [Shewanella marina]
MLAAAVTLLISQAAIATDAPSLDPKLEQDFVAQQQKLGFNKQQSQQFVEQAHYNQAVIDAITTPWEAKPWYQYYPIFLTEKRLQAGLKFWHENQQAISDAAKKYQVDPQIIVAIIGIETFYGQYFGNYPVKDALYTLGFYYPARADFFRKEFGHLQKLIVEEQLDVNTLKGSYAGAMGYGQFIPSSYLAYAVDGDGDGRRDLIGSKNDAIASVANYFHQHGWQQGAPVALPLTAKAGADIADKLWDHKPLKWQVSDILGSNLALTDKNALNPKQPAMLIELEQASHREYWLGLKNFYVITRYNRSPLYAMAVYQFSQELKAAHAAQ